MGNSTTTKQRILDSARELLHKSSYNEVGVQEICNHANVKKGSFYHFFTSKEELVLTMLDQIWDDFQEQFIKTLSPPVLPLERIRNLPVMAHKIQRKAQRKTGQMPGCPFGNLGLELSTQSEAIRQKIHQIFVQFTNPIEKVLEEAQAKGELANIDIQASAKAIFAFLEGIILMAKVHNNPELILQLGKGIDGLMISLIEAET